LTFLRNKRKGRAMPDDLIKAEEEGETGFLAVGGNWDQRVFSACLSNLSILPVQERKESAYIN